MHAKTNRQNHDFQIAYFLAGSCHTPDGAYALLCDLRDDRSDALKSYAASRLKQEAKRIRAARKAQHSDEAEQLEGRAELEEMLAFEDTVAKNVAAAKAELDFIETCMARVNPLRKYADLPDAEAHEAMQSEEWRLELIHRAENFLLTQGGIPADQFATMRMHPMFGSSILPALEHIKKLIGENGTRAVALLEAERKDGFSLPKLLENKAGNFATGDK